MSSFEHLDPNQIKVDDIEKCQREKTFKPIEIGNIEELRQQSKQLDMYQKYVVQMAVKYARGQISET